MQVYNPRLSTTNALWWPCLPPPFSPSPLMQFGILKAMMRFRVFGQVRIQVASIRTDTQDALAVFTKCRESLQDGPRLENIAWRLWHRELKFKGQDDSNLLDEKVHSMGEYAILDEKSAYRPPTPSEPTGFPPPYAVPLSEGDLPTPSTLPTCSLHEGMHPFHKFIFFSVLPVSLYVFQSAFVYLQGNILPRLLASHVSCYLLIGVIRVLIILSSLYRTPITIHPRASCILHITILFTITPPSSIPVNTAAHPPAILSE